VHALTAAHGPVVLNSSTYPAFLSSNGNVAPELFKCLAPLKAAGRLAGVVALAAVPATRSTKTANSTRCNCCAATSARGAKSRALASIAQRVSENLRLMASLHGFYDNALEAFATAIDVKHVNIHGHSLRVGRYASAIARPWHGALRSAALRSAGYLHDIGKVAVDRRLFGKRARSIPKSFVKWPTTRSSVTRS